MNNTVRVGMLLKLTNHTILPSSYNTPEMSVLLDLNLYGDVTDLDRTHMYRLEEILVINDSPFFLIKSTYDKTRVIVGRVNFEVAAQLTVGCVYSFQHKGLLRYGIATQSEKAFSTAEGTLGLGNVSDVKLIATLK